MKTIAFFNNKGGVGKTTLVYHLACMFADRGVHALAVDLDPQANLTSMFLAEDALEELWPDSEHPKTILGDIHPILRGTGDILDQPHLERISSRLDLIPGDLGLARFEDKLSDAWPRCHNKDESAFRTMTAFHRIIQKCAGTHTDLVLIDVGPNLGAINRAALIAADLVVVPLGPDLFSLQGLRNLGPTLRDWSASWTELLAKAPRGLSMPAGTMTPAGYIVMQHGLRDNRPVQAYKRWMDRIPNIYRTVVLDEPSGGEDLVEHDPHCLAQLKHYRSLMPMGMESRKPMFALKAADGAIGAHTEAVQNCYTDFLALAKRIGSTAGIAVA
jgi:chromosome partitioning protein